MQVSSIYEGIQSNCVYNRGKAVSLTDGDLSIVSRPAYVDLGDLLGLAGCGEGKYLHRSRVSSKDVEVTECDLSAQNDYE